MTEYSINLRKLVEDYVEPNSLASRPPVKDKQLNSTQVKMAEMYDNLRRFAKSAYTPEQLEKMHPVLDYKKAIDKVHNEILAQTLPKPEEVLNGKS